MLSRANRLRTALEWMLRVVSFGLLIVLLLRAMHPDRSTRTAIVSSISDPGALRTALRAWTISTPPALHLRFAAVPSPVERDWLRALSRAGTPVTWDGDRLSATAVTVTRMVDPVPTWRADIAAPAAGVVLLRDNVGALDTVRADGSGISAVLPSLVGRFGATSGGTTAWAGVRDSVLLRKLLVEGKAGWETKFAIAALQERGWSVDALTHVAPGVDVREGAPSLPDTARYAAVIAIDSSATLIAENVAAYVRSGGGLVTLHDAAGIGPVGAPVVMLERRADGTAVSARRAGQGRVVHVGYTDVWRSRMAGPNGAADPAASNRAWWGDLIASVAYAPRDSLHVEQNVDPAPLASLVDRIGERSASVTSAARPFRGYGIPTTVLFALLLATLLLEWASRRLRGAR